MIRRGRPIPYGRLEVFEPDEDLKVLWAARIAGVAIMFRLKPEIQILPLDVNSESSWNHFVAISGSGKPRCILARRLKFIVDELERFVELRNSIGPHAVMTQYKEAFKIKFGRPFRHEA